MSPAPPAAPSSYVGSLEALAAAVGRDPSLIPTYKAKGAPITRGPEGYAVEPLLAWMEENIRKPATAETDEKKLSERQLLLRAQRVERECKARLSQIEVAIRTGRLVPVEQVKEKEVAKVQVVRQALLALPTAVAHHLVGLTAEQVRELLDRRIRDVLERFAKS